MSDELEELVQFLDVGRADVCAAALDITSGLTASAQGVERLRPQLDKLLAALLRLVAAPGVQADHISRLALASLVNLSQDERAAAKLCSMNTIGRIMDFIRDKSCPHVKLLVMLLANLTVSEHGSQDLLQLGQGAMEGLHMAILLKLFVMSAVAAGDVPGTGVASHQGKSVEDEHEHIASILTNVTRLRTARALLLQPGRGLLQALVSQLAAPSLVRRRGAASALRNCCLSAQEDGSLPVLVGDSAVLRKTLEPISGKAPVEPDDCVREAIAESIQMLATTDIGRRALLDVNADQLLRKGYEFEEHPGVCAAMEAAFRSFMFGPTEEPAAADTTGLSDNTQ